MDLQTLLHTVPAVESRPDSDDEHVRDMMRLLGVDACALDPMTRIPVALRALAEGSSLTHQGAPLQSVYVVRCGSLKSVRTLEDGYDLVTALALPGDVLGFEGLHSGHCATTDIALEFSTVYALPLSSLHALRQKCPALDDAWQRALSRQLARAAATTEMLAAVASEVRLARFILWLSARATELGRSPRRLRMNMCRRDIASLLGVAHETVSRSFTTMADAGLLKVNRREIEILDFAQLQARARATRRPADAGPIVVPLKPRNAMHERPVRSTHWSNLLPAGATL